MPIYIAADQGWNDPSLSDAPTDMGLGMVLLLSVLYFAALTGFLWLAGKFGFARMMGILMLCIFGGSLARCFK